MARSMVEGFDAADPAVISAREVMQEWSGPAAADGPTFRPARGYTTMLESLHRALLLSGGDVRLAMPVRTISWRRGHVTVEARALTRPAATLTRPAATLTRPATDLSRGAGEVTTGERVRIEARRALITLPLGVLQATAGSPGAVLFDPPLTSKRHALDGLASGPVIKLVLQFKRPFWAELDDGRYRNTAFFFAPDALFPTFWTSLPLRTATLVAWCAGPRAERLANATDAEVFAAARASLRSLFGRRGGHAQRIERIAWHDWQADLFARGAYSYVKTNASTARRVLARPVADTLYFAGEACDTSGEAGTVGGALASGMATARRILRAARKA